MHISKNKIYEAEDPERPGDVIFMDQIKSPTSGLIAQITGLLATNIYQ